MHAYVAKANDAIHDFDLEIRSTLDQRDRSRVFALVRTISFVGGGCSIFNVYNL